MQPDEVAASAGRTSMAHIHVKAELPIGERSFRGSGSLGPLCSEWRLTDRSLAAYGIDPTAAVVEPPLADEDGGVEEGSEDDDSDSDDDDVKLVFTGQTGRALDLRYVHASFQLTVVNLKQRRPMSSGSGNGHTHQPVRRRCRSMPHRRNLPLLPKVCPNLTQLIAAATTTVNQTTEYTPTTRPENPQIPPSGDSGTAPNVIPASAAGTHPSSAVPGISTLPPSQLPPALSQSTHPKIEDPAHPSGIIPSNNGSVYEIDLMQFEGSGQPWRRPGSDITEYFNFGFDEATYPRFLRFRAEMMAGREAMVRASKDY